MQELKISRSKQYARGVISYNVQERQRNTSGILIPEQIALAKRPPVYLGCIGYTMSDGCDSLLELDSVCPLTKYPNAKSTGLGSFILSHTFQKIYEESINNREINPDTRLLVDTRVINLIEILENRGFKKEDSGYITTIQEAGEKSEKILRERNWI